MYQFIHLVCPEIGREVLVRVLTLSELFEVHMDLLVSVNSLWTLKIFGFMKVSAFVCSIVYDVCIVYCIPRVLHYFLSSVVVIYFKNYTIKYLHPRQFVTMFNFLFGSSNIYCHFECAHLQVCSENKKTIYIYILSLYFDYKKTVFSCLSNWLVIYLFCSLVEFVNCC